MIVRANRLEARDWVEARAAILDSGENPFATSAWTLHFIDHVAKADWVFWCGEVDGRSLLLMYSESGAPRHTRALTNYYASLYTPFVGAADGVGAEALAHELSEMSPALATVDLAPMSGADADGVLEAFKKAGWLGRRYACFGNWYLPCDGLNFDTYMASRPSALVNTWNRKRKRFSTGSNESRLQLVTEPSQVALGMRAFEQVYSKSWKQAEPYPTFVADWARICAERGWLRLGIAWAGTTPIAAQFWFTIDRRAYIFKLAYDEEYSKLSAGTVLSAFMFRYSIDTDRVVEIDYLTGDDEYKQSWMTHRRQRVGVIACNLRTFRGAARAAYEWAGAARQLLRRRATHGWSMSTPPDQTIAA